MKALITLLLATTFSSAAFARDEGRLSITLAAQSNVQVLIDNRVYHLNDNAIVLNKIRPGHHTIQVYRIVNNNRNNWSNRNSLLYSSAVHVKPNYHVDIMINSFGRALVDERDLRYNNDGWKDDDRYGRHDNYRDADDRYYQAMSDREFNQFVQKIRGQWFENDKMSVAKHGFTERHFATQQVRQVLQLFAADRDKLELAKLAYRNTTDQRNYHQLYDVFSFQRSRKELDQYIRNNRP